MKSVGLPVLFLLLGFICASIAVSPRKCQPCPPALISPICGSDGRLYPDRCHLKAESCRSNKRIREIPWKKCKPKTCNVACTLEYTELCGEDGEIYGGNKCTFLWRSCRKPTPFKEAPMSTCGGGRKWPGLTDI